VGCAVLLSARTASARRPATSAAPDIALDPLFRFQQQSRRYREAAERRAVTPKQTYRPCNTTINRGDTLWPTTARYRASDLILIVAGGSDAKCEMVHTGMELANIY